MKKIRIDKRSDYDSVWFYGINRSYKSLLRSHIGLLFSKPLFIYMLISLFVASFFSNKLFAVFLGLLAVYFFELFKLKRMRISLKVTRDFPKKSKEESEETMTYSFKNQTSGTLNDIIIFDRFDGEYQAAQNGIQYYLEGLRPFSAENIIRRFKLDNGMGKKHFGPLNIYGSDAIGLHRINYSDDSYEKMDVFPFVHRTIPPMVSPNESSVSYGAFDSLKRGENVNFYKTREYRQGDSVKTINWKLSLKGQKIIVNEYENNSNADIQVLLIDDNRLHVGVGRDSTFEYCKDITLSLFQNHISNNNRVGLLSYQKIIAPRSGKKHLVSLEMLMAGLELKTISTADLYHKSRFAPKDFLEFQHKIKRRITCDSNLYIVASLFPGKLWDYYLEFFKEIAMRGYLVHLIVVEGISFLTKSANDAEKVWSLQLAQQLPKEKEKLEKLCKSAKIKFHYVKIDQNNYQVKMRDIYRK